LRVKICGITKPEQGWAIAQLGATALGFICTHQSPRYVTPEQIREIVDRVAKSDHTAGSVDRVGVFVDASLEEIERVVAIARLNVVQLHGNESPETCQKIRTALSQVELIKALRVRSLEILHLANQYAEVVDTLLLDAYHPGLYGGTGQTLDWQVLRSFHPACPWLLAGGLTPENVLEALSQVQPDGIDLSSGVERSPGDKDLDKVALLFQHLNQVTLKTWLKSPGEG
jgi:phosphoribosylanthranilate isomerase